MNQLKRACALLLSLGLTLSLAACGSGGAQPSGTADTTPAPLETAAPEPTPTPAADPYDAVKNYWSADQLTQAWGPDQVVEHLFFHPVIAYPKYAFTDSSASQAQ